MFEVRTTFKDALAADRAEQVLARTAVALTRDECEVVAVFERAWPDLQPLVTEGRELRHLLHGARLDPLSMELSAGPGLGTATFHSLMPPPNSMPDAAQRTVQRNAPVVLLEPLDVPRAGPQGLIWTDTPGLLQLPSLLIAVVGLAFTCLVTTMVSLAGTHEWWNLQVAVPAALCLASGLLWACQEARWRGRILRLAASFGILGALYGFGAFQARTSPGRITWPAFIAAALVVATYSLCVRVVITSFDRSRGLWRSAGGALVALGVAAGLTKEVVDAPRRLLQEGLGFTQMTLAVTPYQVLTTIDGQVLGTAVGGIAACWLILITVHRHLPSPSIPYIAPVFLVLITWIALMSTLPAYAIGRDLRDGRRIEEGELSSCVMLLTGGTVGADARWSTPRVLIGAVTGPALVLDPARLDETTYVTRPRVVDDTPIPLTKDITVKTLPAGTCANAPFTLPGH